MEYALLGPLEVRADNGDPIPINRLKQRQLLAALLLRPNQVVTIDQLALDLWDERPPTSIRSNIKTYIAGLRSLLSPHPRADGPIHTGTGGYRINVGPDDLDIIAFNRLVKTARQSITKDNLNDADRSFGKALDLWRGRALHDISLTETLSAAATKLTEARLDVLSDWADVRLGLGDITGLIEWLREGIREDPYRERLHAQLMLALYRQGRPGQALTTYNDLRKLLANELGTDPTKPLQDLYQKILVSDPDLDPSPLPPPATLTSHNQHPPGPRPPRQLPINVPVLFGRDHEITMIEYRIASGTETGAPPVIAITGTPGAGKSALAVHIGHIVRESFPDGQLYVNLRGATPGMEPLEPHDALARFLKVLGVPASEVPSQTDHAAALFRTLLADRRVLVVLDDAASTAQVRPLLPSGPGCATLITSRRRLASLQNASSIELAPLAPADAVTMLKHLVGERITQDLTSSERLARLTGHLPLALHVAAARLTARPDWTVHHLVERLGDEHGRLQELQSDEINVAASLALSYNTLRDSKDARDRAAAKAFCLLGVLNVPTISVSAAAALFGATQAEADLALERLLDAFLLSAPAPGRFTMHDLVRLCAQETAVQDGTDEQKAAALQRALGFYLATAQGAVKLLYPHRVHVPAPEVPETPQPLGDRNEAKTWLDTERSNLLAAATQGMRSTDDANARLGVALALSMNWDLELNGLMGTMGSIGSLALQTAKELHDLETQGHALRLVATSDSFSGRFSAALKSYEEEHELCLSTGDRFGEQRVHGNMAETLCALGRPTEALHHAERQLAISREIGARVGERFALMMMGRAHQLLRRPDLALQVLREALAQAGSAGDDHHVAHARHMLGLVHLDLKDFSHAREELCYALEGQPAATTHDTAEILVRLSQASRLLGDPQEAIENARRAIELARRCGYLILEGQAYQELANALDNLGSAVEAAKARDRAQELVKRANAS